MSIKIIWRNKDKTIAKYNRAVDNGVAYHIWDDDMSEEMVFLKEDMINICEAIIDEENT